MIHLSSKRLVYKSSIIAAIIIVASFADFVLSSRFSLRNSGANRYTPQANPSAPNPNGMFFPKSQNEMKQPKGGSIESLFASHKDPPSMNTDTDSNKASASSIERMNATDNVTSSKSLTQSDRVNHYGKTPSVNIADVMDVGSGKKKENNTSIKQVSKKNAKPIGAMNALKEELVEEHGKLPKAHASDEDPSKYKDDGDTKNKKHEPKVDPAWNFMMNNIKKEEAPPGVGQLPQIDQKAPVQQPAMPEQQRTPQQPPSTANQSPQKVQQQQNFPPAAAAPAPQQQRPVQQQQQNSLPAAAAPAPQQQQPVQQQQPSTLRSNKPPSPPPLSDVRGIINEFKHMD